MPGLLRGIARTAVVAGTATAVSNRVSRRQAGRWAQQEQQQYPVTPASSVDNEADMKVAQLRELGELKSRGILTDEEFEQQKRWILSL
jgi:putative oligomerization/nucleic acid binding protein